MTAWALHQEPHRHYKHLNGAGKWSWQNRDRTRIASVTKVLDGDADRLLQWAIGRTVVAAEYVARQYLDAGQHLDGSVLDFGELLGLTGLMPDAVRDFKGELGTEAHEYLSARLCGVPHDGRSVPYGYRAAIDEFLGETFFEVLVDEHGPLCERAVGDEATAVAGTYDAVGMGFNRGGLQVGAHRIDLKSSNTLQPKMYAQVAEYERLAVLCGEQRSDWLTIIHVDALGNWSPSTIPTGGPEEALALAYFDAALVLYRTGPPLAKLLG